MASNTIGTITLLLALNLLFFTLVSSTPCAPPAPKVPKVPRVPKVPKVPKVPTLPPNTKTPPSPKPTNYCPRDALKLGVCANVLNGLLNIVIGSPPSDPECCSVIQGLLDAEAAACLCTLIKADVVGIRLRIPVALSLLLNSCGKKLPKDFQCA